MSTSTSGHETLVAQLSEDLRAADPASLAVRLVRAQGQGVNIALERALALLTGERPVVIDTLHQSSITGAKLWPSDLAQHLSTVRAVLIDSPSLGGTAFQDACAQMIEDRCVRAWVKFSGSTPEVFPLRENALIVISDPAQAPEPRSILAHLDGITALRDAVYAET